MVIVYIIKSLIYDYRYIGITSNLDNRFKRHNQNRNKSTRNRGPFKLIHTEKYPSYSEARKREKFLKSGIGRKFLDHLR